MYELLEGMRELLEDGKSAGVGSVWIELDSPDDVGCAARMEARLDGISPQRGRETAQAHVR